MGETRIVFCQKPIGACKDCPDLENCSYNGKQRLVKKPVGRTCPECGYVNKIDDLNCEKCDYPLEI